MAEPSLLQRERALLNNLIRLAAERARAEIDTETSWRARTESLTATFDEARQRIAAELESQLDNAERDFQQSRRQSAIRFEQEYGAVQKEYGEVSRGLAAQFDQDRAALERKTQEKSWSVSTVHEANKSRIDERHQKIVHATDEAKEVVRKTEAAAVELLQEAKQVAEYEKKPVLLKVDEDKPLGRLNELLAEAEESLERLQRVIVFKLFKGERLLWIFVGVWVFAALAAAGILWRLAVARRIPVLPSGWPEGWYYYLIGCIIGTPLLGVAVWFLFGLRARSVVRRRYLPLRRTLDEAAALAQSIRDDADETQSRQLKEDKAEEERELKLVQEKFAQKWDELQARFAHHKREAEEKYPPLLLEKKEQYDRDLRRLEEKHGRRLADIRKRSDDESGQVRQRYERDFAASEERHDREWNALSTAWQNGLRTTHAEVAAIDGECRRLFADWQQLEAPEWKLADRVPGGLRFGEMAVGRDQIPEGQPADPRLDGVKDFSLPALLPFPERASMLIKASDAGRGRAVGLLQAVMLRFLTALPPGKVRFTIIDPVGLGENFASFMHLVDHDELLVNYRIWTEPQQIEQRLADLTEHMENVIQKYLRNQFSSLEEYNAQAGEIAEPYRVLVVANFPVNFTESSARRLLSIAGSGASSGVYTLVSVDMKLPLPQDFQLKDLERLSLNLSWREGRFQWKDADVDKYPLTVDEAPPAEMCTRIMNRLGAAAKAASRVEVPFEHIAPADGRWWTSDSRQGIRVALGRAGATKLQVLQLGQGTSQHVLIAGKTGSGKSTLLHALITNTALHYGPDEVEFYLIDFKKGVEFKTYASHELPHARVIAIESEREFGLSVLQRLDQELKNRGERFRTAEVQDLNAYRNANGNEPLPRVLLIVDEFQEFFTEDDKIAQDVSLLLDRLVRQGRAFGIHVLLGSQTLGGAYSLARSTLGQMAVRIALQCSEADAHLILSEDNGAARLLTRPGEAIYNDANGLKEGNNFFQVVWLPDERKEDYLNRVHELARVRRVPPRSQIIFEGNAPADLRKNHLLQRLLHEPAPASRKAFLAWLGEAMAIKDPTAAVFRPQSGSNLLIIGQQDEPALGILTAALVGLAAQTLASSAAEPPGATPFYILDGTPIDHSHFGFLSSLKDVVPQAVKAGGFRELPGLLTEVAAELERRQLETETEQPPLFLFVNGIQRLRDLRKQEDDFSFSREDKPASPAQQFGKIVREGPAMGLYTLIWCDSLNNVNRAFDRQALREFEMKILFQMSVNDSSVLIDSPAASKLGMHHALFYTEERGQPEKFRPYGPPSAEWLQLLKQQFTTVVPST